MTILTVLLLIGKPKEGNIINIKIVNVRYLVSNRLKLFT